MKYKVWITQNTFNIQEVDNPENLKSTSLSCRFDSKIFDIIKFVNKCVNLRKQPAYVPIRYLKGKLLNWSRNQLLNAIISYGNFDRSFTYKTYHQIKRLDKTFQLNTFINILAFLSTHEFAKRDWIKYYAYRMVLVHGGNDVLRDDYNWRTFYNANNKAKNKTLDALRFPIGQRLFNLRFTDLIQPELDHLCLITRMGFGTRNSSHIRYCRNDIINAVKSIDNVNKVDLRRTKRFKDLGLWLIDYPDFNDHTGSFKTLVDRCVHYHRELYRPRARNFNNIDYVDPFYRINKVFPNLSIPLDSEGINYLDCSDKLMAEGNQMHHCVASYSDACIKGNSLIFHVDYKNERATVEVSKQLDPFGTNLPKYYIRQAYGPCNQKNYASAYGERELQKYCKKLNGDNNE